MWERNPNGKDTWFGVARVGVGMTSLVEGGAVTFTEPDDMPTEIELEPATGKALQEFVRFDRDIAERKADGDRVVERLE